MDQRVHLAKEIEKINKQRVMITAIIRGMPTGLSRQQRRHYPLSYEGTNITIKKYLVKLGAMLPAMLYTDKNVPINHGEQLCAVYMMTAAEGVDDYLKAVIGVMGDTISSLTLNATA